MIPLITAQTVAFWVFAPLAVAGALGMVLSRKPVHSALSLAGMMVALGCLYASLDAPFLFVAQIIVYTGAVMMMFLFVLMMVGVDTPDSAVETLKAQRPLAILAGIGLAALLIFAIVGSITQPAVTVVEANAQFGGNAQGLANLMFGRYIFVFELASALLITAAVGAMILAHRQRVTPKRDQRELAEERMADYATKGEHPGPLPNSGVYATTNSIAAPALLPDGSIAPKSISQTLLLRGAVIDPIPLAKVTDQTFAAIEAAVEEEDE